MRNAHKVCIGRDPKGNKIFLRPEERLIHTHVIGSPIRGKSCFLELVTRKDILFRRAGSIGEWDFREAGRGER